MMRLVPQEVEPRQRFDVVVDGLVVGDVVQVPSGLHGERVWLATLQLGEHEALPVALARISGSAGNPEQAVKNAVHAWRAHCRRALQLIDDLDARLRGVPL